MKESFVDVDQEIDAAETQVIEAKKKLTEARRKRAPEPVSDYEFQTATGPVKLSELFGNNDDLIVIHNMGTQCVYCTLWADGFVGLWPHLQSRSSVVVSSPDPVEVQVNFAKGRSWPFKMVSAKGTQFFQDMGFWMEDGNYAGPWPGVSTFRRESDGSLFRVGKASFGPGDDFCPAWPLIDLLAGGSKGWEPEYDYSSK